MAVRPARLPHLLGKIFRGTCEGLFQLHDSVIVASLVTHCLLQGFLVQAASEAAAGG